MNQLDFLAIFAPIIAFWGQFKSFFTKILSFFIRSDNIYHFDLTHYLLAHLFENSKVYYWGNKDFRSFGIYINKYNLEGYEAFHESKNDLFFLYRGKIPIFVSSKDTYHLKITYCRFLFNLESILSKVVEWYYVKLCDNVKAVDEYLSKRGGGYSIINVREEATVIFGQPKSSEDKTEVKSPLNAINSWCSSQSAKYLKYLHLDYNDLYRKEHTKERDCYFWSKEGLRLRNSVERWFQNKSWFIERGIAWSRGCLLYGIPGAGRSTLVKKVAEYMALPVFYFDLTNMTNSFFSKKISDLPSNGCIVLIEDIDCQFNLRERVSKNLSTAEFLTFDCLLNNIAGAQKKPGIFWIITTNHKNNLDPAIYRPGRLDEQIEMGFLEKEGKKVIANNILRDWPDIIEKVVSEKKNYTAADFENKCIKIAEEKFWNK